MEKRGMLFTDMDGTFVFHEGAHGVVRLGDNGDGTVQVRDPASGRELAARDVSASGSAAYVSEETRRLYRELRSRFEIVLVTGGRPSTVHDRLPALDFAERIILENGGAIFWDSLSPDAEWDAVIDPARPSLEKVRAELRSRGWNLDDEGRTAATRIRLQDNPERAEEDVRALREGFRLPGDLVYSNNFGHLDVLPKAGGKANAVKFLMERAGCRRSETVGLGDDVNDIGFLEVVGRAHVLAGSFDEALAAARENGWHVSQKPGFEGIEETLRRILAG